MSPTPMVGWSAYLPSVLQINQVYWIIAVCVATVCFLRKLTDKPWLIQFGSFAVSSAFSVTLLGRVGMVYAFAAALICSSLATTFYDLLYDAIESIIVFLVNKVRAFFGAPPVNPLSTPRPSTPQSVITDKTP